MGSHGWVGENRVSHIWAGKDEVIQQSIKKDDGVGEHGGHSDITWVYKGDTQEEYFTCKQKKKIAKKGKINK